MRTRLLMVGIAAAAAVVLLSTAPALASPTIVNHDNLSSCDVLSVPNLVDELGILTFPPDETIGSAVHPENDIGPCPPTNLALVDQVVDIINLTLRTFDNVWYVADPETTITNVDGLVNGEEAFRIDAIGLNTPLIGEFGGILPGIWEPGELWRFVLQDYSNTLLVGPAMLGSVGVPSPGSTISSGSIIATPEPGLLALVALGLAGLLASRRRG